MSAPYSAACDPCLLQTASEGVTTCVLTMEPRDFSSSQKNVGLGWEGVSSQFITLSSLSPAPHNLGVGVGLTNRFEPCNLLKMLMRRRRAPGSIER